MLALRKGVERALQAQRLQIVDKPLAPVGADGSGSLERQIETVKPDDETPILCPADGRILDGCKSGITVQPVVHVPGRRPQHVAQRRGRPLRFNASLYQFPKRSGPA